MDINGGSSTVIATNDSNSTDEELIEELKNLYLYNSMIFIFFIMIFSNEYYIDIAQSLINSLIPVEENIKNLNIENYDIYNYPFDIRILRVDIRAKDDKGNIYVVELQVGRIDDLLGREVPSTSRMFNSLFNTGGSTTTDEKIYSINLLYYDLYPDEPNYYHYLYTHEFNNDKVTLPFKHYIIVELNKFKRNFTNIVLSEIKKKLSNGGVIDKITERNLWFLFLTFSATVLSEPKNAIYKKFEKKIEELNKEIEISKKYIIFYVRNDMTVELYRIFKKYSPYNKAIKLLQIILKQQEPFYIDETDDYLKMVRMDQEIARMDQELALKDKEIARIDQEIALKDKEIARIDQEIALKDKEIARMDQELALKDKEIAPMNQELALKDKEIAPKKEAEVHKDEEIDRLKEELENLKRRYSDPDQDNKRRK